MQASLSKYFQVKRDVSSSQVPSETISLLDNEPEGQKTESSVSKGIVDRIMKRKHDGGSERKGKLRRLNLFGDLKGDFDFEEENIFDQDEVNPKQSPIVAKGATKISYTPLEKQVMSLKERYPDSLLMVECGYRMRFFGQDATDAAQVLGIFAHMDHNFMVASVPTYRTIFHCKRLLAAGFKVGIVRQTETAAIRKSGKTSSSSTFDRAVTGVFTQGTVIDDDDPAFEGLQGQQQAATEDQSDEEMNLEQGDQSYALTQLNQERDHWIASIWQNSIIENIRIAGIAIVAVCVRSHELWVRVFDCDTQSLQGLRDHLQALEPTEVIIPDTISRHFQEQLKSFLPSQTRVKSLPSFTFQQSLPPDILDQEWSALLLPLARQAMAGLKHYLAEFQLTSVLLNPSLNFEGDASTSAHSQDEFALDGITMRDLEIFNQHGACEKKLKQLQLLRQYQQHGSGTNISSAISGGLFSILDNCLSIYGRRNLKRWIMHPLISISAIQARQQVIEYLLTAREDLTVAKVQQSMIDVLKKFPDVEKMLTALQYNRISPPRMKTLLQLTTRMVSLCFNESTCQNMPPLLRSWIMSSNFTAIANQASRCLEEDMLSLEDGEESLTGFLSFAREQSYPKLAALRLERQQSLQQINDELVNIRALLRRPSLEFATHRTGAVSQVEHLIELPIQDEDKVPSTWFKVNSTKHIVRFHTPEVLAIQDVLYRIRDEIKIAGQESWRSFCSEVKVALYDQMRKAVSVLGNLDAILSLVTVAALPGYTKPEYNDKNEAMIITQGRHPMLERISEEANKPYLPNDVRLGSNFGPHSCQIITGPNMGGKSSYCRLVALLALMGQIGSYIPAEAATMLVYDRILTRMGSEDDLQSGRSTFFCELLRTNAILRHVTSKSLVIIDELGRGTATHDGYAIAEATLKYIVKRLGCSTMFITHFAQIGSLADHPEMQSQCFNSHMSYLESVNSKQEQEIVFLYKLVEEPSQGSYGINVARLAGFRKSVLDRAIEVSQLMLHNNLRALVPPNVTAASELNDQQASARNIIDDKSMGYYQMPI